MKARKQDQHKSGASNATARRRNSIVNRAKAKAAAKPASTDDAITIARRSRRNRRRVIRTVVGAVLGGVIAGPIGAVVGTAVGATSRRVPGSGNASVQMEKPHQKKPAKPSASSKTRTRRPAQKKRFVNIYPNIP